jgi:hypothetical protein
MIPFPVGGSGGQDMHFFPILGCPGQYSICTVKNMFPFLVRRGVGQVMHSKTKMIPVPLRPYSYTLLKSWHY